MAKRFSINLPPEQHTLLESMLTEAQARYHLNSRAMALGKLMDIAMGASSTDSLGASADLDVASHEAELYRVVHEACLDASEIATANREDFGLFEVAAPGSPEQDRAMELWGDIGGYMLLVLGDPRFGGQNRARCLLWMEQDEQIEIAKAYHGAFEDAVDAPAVTVLELIPDEGADWDPPKIANGVIGMEALDD